MHTWARIYVFYEMTSYLDFVSRFPFYLDGFFYFSSAFWLKLSEIFSIIGAAHSFNEISLNKTNAALHLFS
jgi:hypothetical protein